MGSLSLLQQKIFRKFYVSNCDIFINTNINELFEHHKTQKAYLTIVVVKKTFKKYYGSCNINHNGI